MDQLHKIHSILGSPSERILRKFRNQRIKYTFPLNKPMPFYKLLPSLSASGLDLMKSTLIYNPDSRITIYKLMDHPYFYDIQLVKKLSLKY